MPHFLKWELACPFQGHVGQIGDLNITVSLVEDVLALFLGHIHDEYPNGEDMQPAELFTSLYLRVESKYGFRY